MTTGESSATPPHAAAVFSEPEKPRRPGESVVFPKVLDLCALRRAKVDGLPSSPVDPSWGQRSVTLHLPVYIRHLIELTAKYTRRSLSTATVSLAAEVLRPGNRISEPEPNPKRDCFQHTFRLTRGADMWLRQFGDDPREVLRWALIARYYMDKPQRTVETPTEPIERHETADFVYQIHIGPAGGFVVYWRRPTWESRRQWRPLTMLAIQRRPGRQRPLVFRSIEAAHEAIRAHAEKRDINAEEMTSLALPSFGRGRLSDAQRQFYARLRNQARQLAEIGAVLARALSELVEHGVTFDFDCRRVAFDIAGLERYGVAHHPHLSYAGVLTYDVTLETPYKPDETTELNVISIAASKLRLDMRLVPPTHLLADEEDENDDDCIEDETEGLPDRGDPVRAGEFPDAPGDADHPAHWNGQNRSV